MDSKRDDVVRLAEAFGEFCNVLLEVLARHRVALAAAPPASSSEGPLLLTVSEAAKLLSISKSQVYELLHQGRIPFINLSTQRDGRGFRVPRRALEEWVSQTADSRKG